jgi:hypothetical protein
MIFDLLSIDQIAWTLVTRQQQRFSVGCFRFGDGFSRKCLILTLPRSSIGPNLTNCWRIPLLSVRMAITNKSVTKLIVLVATVSVMVSVGMGLCFFMLGMSADGRLTSSLLPTISQLVKQKH